MNKVRQEEGDNGVSSEGTRIGVCVGKERNRGLGALKWAIEKEIIPSQGHVYLLHVVPPLRWIPDPKGRGKRSINNLSTEMAQLFRNQHFVEASKMFDEYATLCERNKFTYQLYCLENDLIHEELVSQIFNLKITTLLLERSSQMFLGRARGSESISSNVIKNAPDFCKVLIIQNNKLYCMNKDSGLFSDPSTSPTMKSNMGAPIKIKTTPERSIISENIIKERNDVHLRRFQGKQHNILHRRSFPRVAMDRSEVSDDIQSPKMIRTKSAMQFTERSALHGWLHYEYDESNLVQKNFEEKYAYEGLQSEGLVVNSNTEQSCHRHVFLEDVTFAPSSSGGNDSSIKIMDIPGSLPSHDSIITSKHSAETENLTQSNTPELMPSSESLHKMDRGGTETGDLTKSSMHEAISSCNLWHEMNNVMDVNSEVHKDEASLVLDFDHLQYQLIEAKQSSLKWAQFEAETRENNYKMLEGILRNTKKKIAEAWMQKEDALNEARIASDKAYTYQMKLEELTAATQSSFQNQKILQEQLNHERTSRLMMENQLKETRRLLESIIRNAKTLELKCQEEGKRCEKINSELEKEVQLRKMAEERASKEAEVAVLAQKREQNMYLEYTFEELQLATDNFSEKNMLGRGSYGPVYKGKLHYTTVAIKLLADEGRRGRAEFQKEVGLLSCLHHPHLVMLLGACPERGCIIYEYMANGSLEDRLYCKGDTPPLHWFTRFQICLQIATALLFLHSRPQPVVHRDLKPGNILLDHSFLSKISDVGVAKLVSTNHTFSESIGEYTQVVGTLHYIDPDYYRTGILSCESDIYSLGVIMLQLLTKQPPLGISQYVENALNRGQFDKILDRSAGAWPVKEATALARVSLKCMELKRADRPRLESMILPLLESIQKTTLIVTSNVAS